jgi:hypothetical protein
MFKINRKPKRTVKGMMAARTLAMKRNRLATRYKHTAAERNDAARVEQLAAYAAEFGMTHAGIVRTQIETCAQSILGMESDSVY